MLVKVLMEEKMPLLNTVFFDETRGRIEADGACYKILDFAQIFTAGDLTEAGRIVGLSTEEVALQIQHDREQARMELNQEKN
jgi:hypothetical protein